MKYVQGYEIPFDNTPFQFTIPSNNLSQLETIEINKSITDLIHLGAIVPCQHVEGEFISKVFLRPKPNGKFRFILNLKPLNKFIPTKHFKMEDIRTAIKLVDSDYYMGTIDLKESYFLVPICEKHRKYLRFLHLGQLYEFTAMPYGLSTAPGVFTKLLKPVVAHLRSQDFMSTIYLDDCLCIGQTYEECLQNINSTVKLFECLGLIINTEKSNLVPNRQCKFLGFIIDTHNLCLELPTDKKILILQLVTKFTNLKKCTIRDFAKLLGTLVAASPAIPYGMMHTKIMEREKHLALINSNDNYDSSMQLSRKILPDLQWWLQNLNKSSRNLKDKPLTLEIFSDASLTGWGGYCNGERIGGMWSKSEQNLHINQLELIAAYFVLKSFANHVHNTGILLRIDNTTAIACINKMGSVQFPHLNKISREIWEWCQERNIHIYASYIKSKDNVIADQESRNTNIDTEWELSTLKFNLICIKFGQPNIDLFASRINNKCPKYVSWKRDPYAFNVDAFTLNWSNYFFYAFPPFAIITRCLQKIRNEKAKGILVFPLWPSQPWYPLAKSLMVSEPLIFHPDDNLLQSPFRTKHPLSATLTLAAGLFCGMHSRKEVCQHVH